jgi:hypothetical protein
MKEQDFGSSIEQDFGYDRRPKSTETIIEGWCWDVKPGQLPDGHGGWTLY